MAAITLNEWLAAEPFALTMSSGFFSFFAHAGMLSVLEEENLLPNQISGSSAGALVGALWGSGRTMPELAQRLFELKKADFWDPGVGAGLLKGRMFRRILREESAAQRLEDCRIPVSVSAFDGYARSTRVFSSGPFDKAVYAACAVPFLFRPVWIDGRPYWDGGIKDRPGLAGIEPGVRTFYHHISSRSRWRRKDSPALRVPRREAMTSLVIDGLPRVGPNKLHHGRDAFDAAYRATRKALDQSVGDSIVRIDAASCIPNPAVASL